ncbi:hypothetical protein D3C72_2011320 [compost metagenome]
MDDHEGGHKVELLTHQCIGVTDLELHPVCDPGRLGVRPCTFDGRRMEITADDTRLGKCLGHGDCRQAAAAAKIKDAATSLKFCFDAVQ